MQEINNITQQEYIKKKRWYKKWWGIALIVLLTIFLIFLIIFGLMVRKAYKELTSKKYLQPISKEQLELIQGTEANYSMGAENPIITIVEFSDFNCPLCKDSASKVKNIVEKNKDKIKLIYRDFPVIADDSIGLAMIARCAGEQNKFWRMHDQLFLNQGRVDSKEKIDAMADIIKLRSFQFDKCLKESKYAKQIEKDMSDAIQLNLQGTPTWFINGNKITGDIPYDKFVSLIDELIKYYEINTRPVVK